MMEVDQREEAGDETPSLRLDILCLRAAMTNYSRSDFEPDSNYSVSEQGSGTNSNSALRSWARDLWRVGSNVLLRSDPNLYTNQIIQLLSQYGNGWIPINHYEISAQGSLRRSLSLLESHGLIHFRQRRIRIEGINLRKAIQDKSQFNQKSTCDLEMIKEFLRLLLIPSDQLIPRPSLIGLTSTLRLALNQPEFKLSQGFERFFDAWVRGQLDHLKRNWDLQLNEGEKQVMHAGIKMYEGIRSFHFTSLEIHFLLRTVLTSRSGSSKDEKNTGSRSDSEEETRAKDDLDLLMTKAMTYITVLETTVGSIIVNQMPNPYSLQGFAQHPNPNDLNEHSLYQMLKDCAAVAEQLERLTCTLTPNMIGTLEQLTSFYISGWNFSRQLERTNKYFCGYGEDFGCAFFGRLLDCLKRQGKPEEILTLVKQTKEYLSQLRPGHQFKDFFPAWVINYALNLGQESAHEKESLFLELETYLMDIFRAQDKPRRGSNVHGYGNGVTQRVLPHLFHCLAQLGRYETLHGFISDLGSHLQTLITQTDATHPVVLYIHLPSALETSVKDMDFPIKEALLEDTFKVAETLVKMTWDWGLYESTRKLFDDPMERLISFCFETGMVHELTEFLGELEVFVMNKYGEDRLEPIITTILYFGERVTDELKQMMRSTELAKIDWSVFVEQVKCSVGKWTQLISTPPHVHEKKSWMDGRADLICRKCDLYIEGRK